MAEFQITSGEVLEVLYEDSNPNLIYGIKVKPLDGTPSEDETTLSVMTAKPLNTSILRIPIKGEVVLLLKAPSSYASGTKITADTYYFDIVSLQSSIHHNALPSISAKTVQTSQTSGDSDKYNESNSGNSSKQTDPKIDENFSENPTVKPLQPYIGDLLIEGRYGNSIRFTTTPKSGKFTVAPKWSGGPESAPITIFRNSKQGIDTQKINDFITEDFTNNENIIVMASGQNIEFEQGSGVVTAIQSKGITSWKDENWGTTPQTLISSGRLVFNSSQKEIIAFAKNGIGLSSETNIAIDATNTVTINATKIELGDGANEPLILGNKFKTWSESLIDKLSTLTVITPAGPSSPLSASPQWTSVASLKAQLPNLLSDLSFTKKSASTSSRGSLRVIPIPDFKMTTEDIQQVQQDIDETKAQIEVEEVVDEETEMRRKTREEYVDFREGELDEEQLASVDLDVDDFEIEDDEVEENALEYFENLPVKTVQAAQGGASTVDTTYVPTMPNGTAGGFGGGGTTSDLFAIIAGGEGGYNSMNRGVAGDSPGEAKKYLGKNLTEMPVSELLNFQRSKKLFASGKYQIIPVTMQSFVKNAKIKTTDIFDATTQDKFPEFVVNFARPIVGKYIRKENNNRAEAVLALAKEFASIGVPYDTTGNNKQLVKRGQSFYAGTGGNKASISPEQIEAALDRARNGSGTTNFVTLPPDAVGKGALVAQLAIADAKARIVEQPLGSDWGGKIIEYLRAAGHTTPQLWCASAVTYWWKQAGLQTPPSGAALCSEWAAWGQKTGRFSTSPAIGAAILFRGNKKQYGHIGVVVAINGTQIVTVQGNTSLKGFSTNGVAVAQKQVNMSRVTGFILPR